LTGTGRVIIIQRFLRAFRYGPLEPVAVAVAVGIS